MSITVRQFTPEDLASIGIDKWLTTVFMNKTTFSADEIKLYPYGIRKEYLANIERDGIVDTVTFHATDDDNAIRFITEEYHIAYVKCIDRVIREYITILKNY